MGHRRARLSVGRPFSRNRGYATWEVGSRLEGASPWGAMDMAGNVTEWVADRRDKKYYRSVLRKNLKGPATGDLRVLKGGAWFNSSEVLRAVFRTGFAPENASHGIDFRCAKTLSKGFVSLPRRGRGRAMWACRP